MLRSRSRLRGAPTGYPVVVGALFKARTVRGINSAPTREQTTVGALLKRDTTPESMLPNRTALVSQPVRQAFLFLFIGKPLGIKPLN